MAAEDVARYAVAALDHTSARGQTLMIGGTEPVTWHEVVEALWERARDAGTARRR